MALGRIDRNAKWRLNDVVYYENCAECKVKVEWQHSDPNQNNANNFHSHLYAIGWRQRNVGLFGMGGKEWICNKHR